MTTDAPHLRPFTILVTEGSDPRPLAWLRERATVVEMGLGQAGFDAELARADGVIVRTYTRVTKEFLDRAPRLRVVARAGVGIDNIDVPACRARGVEVVHTPDANTLAVGDYIFGVLLRLVRPWAFFQDEAPAPDEFKRIRNSIAGRQLDELTLGILGMGRVGRRVGRIASAGFGMRVIYNDLLDVAPPLPFPATAVDKPNLWAESDILTIHVNMRAGNENLVGAKELAAMKTGAIVLNASRGEVLDAAALAVALKSGHIAAAALDVFAPEPPPADFPLIGLPNVLLTPHLASRTKTALANMAWVVRDVIEVLEGRPPKHPAP